MWRDRARDRGGGKDFEALQPLHEATARHMMQLYAQTRAPRNRDLLYRTLTKALRRDVDAQPESETRQGFALIARAGEEQPVDPCVLLTRRRGVVLK